MALLSDPQRAALWARWMRENVESGAATKPEVRTLIDALDDYLESNAAAINTSIPAGVRNKFSQSQKAFALALVALRRYG
jgi:hypothetical protein